MTSEFVEQILLAYAGYLFHLLKMSQAALRRKEEFLTKPFIVSVFANVVAVLLLVYVGNTLPPDLIVMSPLTCIMMGVFGSSMLSGFINVKKPKSLEAADDSNLLPLNQNKP
jgi:small basic protein